MAACVLETPSPEPTQPVPTEAVAPALPLQSGTVATSDPVKQQVNVHGEMITQYSAAPQVTIDPTTKYTAVIRTTAGNMEFELFAERAPVTVNNFIFLAEEGFYNGVIFHRVIPSFMIQGGDPTGTGRGGPGYKFVDEFAASLIFDEPGKLAMANSGPNTNGSQFFVTTIPTPFLNGAYTIFGKVVHGQDVANAISLSATDPSDRPVTPIVILGINIATTPN